MLEINSLALYQLLASYLLPGVRILGVFTSAPLFANRNISASIRITIGVLITLIITPTLKPVVIDLLGWTGLLSLTQEFLIGLSIGFTMRLVFAAVELAGELMSMTMGLGFATFFDPQSQGNTSALSQLLSSILLLMFIAMDMHLLLLEILVNSFQDIPLNSGGLQAEQFYSVAKMGRYIFMTGLQLALPVITALLIINMTLGVLTKAAPQLNLFGVGFPVTLMTGLIMFYMSFRYWQLPFMELLEQGLNLVAQLTHKFLSV